jgi:hypothetical protein
VVGKRADFSSQNFTLVTDTHYYFLATHTNCDAFSAPYHAGTTFPIDSVDIEYTSSCYNGYATCENPPANLNNNGGYATSGVVNIVTTDVP